MKLEEFIFRRIRSVDQLRALLMLYEAPTREWDEVELSGRLYLESKRLRDVLDALIADGMARRNVETGRFQFVPQIGETAALLDEVVRMDRERPVSLIRLIYARPNSLEAFSDAFRLRRTQ